MFLGLFTTTFQAVAEVVLLGGVGFWLSRRGILSSAGLAVFNRLVVGLFLPAFIFTKIIGGFSFSAYPRWWVFPLLSFLMTAVGYGCALAVLRVSRALTQDRGEFLGVVSFQNSGYLPLPLVAALLPVQAAEQMFIYIFLFLLGFNMLIFTFGFFLLSGGRSLDLRKMFNAPVVATLLALICVFLKTDKLIPAMILRPLGSLGQCALPLSILVVGANLASMRRAGRSYWKPISCALVLKLLVLPMIFFGLIAALKPPPMIGLLLLLEAAMPPAVLLSVIARSQGQADHLVSQTIFYGHLFGVLTIPFFLSLHGFLYGV